MIKGVFKRYWKRVMIDCFILLSLVILYNYIDCEISHERLSVSFVGYGLICSLSFFIVFRIDKLFWGNSLLEDFIEYVRSKNGK